MHIENDYVDEFAGACAFENRGTGVALTRTSTSQNCRMPLKKTISVRNRDSGRIVQKSAELQAVGSHPIPYPANS